MNTYSYFRAVSEFATLAQKVNDSLYIWKEL